MTAREIIAVWETGVAQHPIDRALTMLRLASPGESRAALARLSVGERDRRLLALREALYGSAIEALSHCPACGGTVELAFTTQDIRAGEHDRITPEADGGGNGAEQMTHDGWTLEFRLPDSTDLAAVARKGDRNQALTTLTRRCLLRGRREGRDFAAEELPSDAVDAWRARLADFDPQAETRLLLHCPACNHEWSELFDIVEFLWTELAADARRLLGEVDALARAYGWSEDEILSLSRFRREAYLEMIGA